MNDQEVKAGTRVKVTITGTVVWDSSLHSNLCVRTDSGNQFYLKYADDVEVIEPEYQIGEVYQDARGVKHLRLDSSVNPWRPLIGSAIDRAENYPERPLVKLVPEQ